MRSVLRAVPAVLLGCIALVACSDSGVSTDSSATTPAGDDAGPSATDAGASATGDAGGGAADAGPVSGCADGPTETCASYNTRSRCVQTAAGSSWVTETCAVGCFAGKCSATACADECVLGAKSGATTCKLWNMGTKAYASADPAGNEHDRARDYDRLLRAGNLPEGAVMNARYTDATFTKVSSYSGYHDAAIWTGSALAAESWRLMATGSPDAAAQVKTLANTMHRDLAVTGEPGSLARVVIPSASTTPLDVANRCADPEWHCGVSYGGAMVDWLGGISRDQYTGFMLGEYVAYIASPDEAVRTMIREDVTAVALELVKVRPQVPASIVINGVPVQKSLALENVILVPSEMTNGHVQITLDTSSASDAQIHGMREFFPDYSIIAKQALGLNVPIKRPSSSVMLGAMVKMAIVMTDGVPAMKTQHDALATYYAANAASWLDVAATWSFSANCGNGYFANHIAFIMAYAYASMEKDPVLGPRITDDVMDKAMWKALGGHKNAYFGFLWGGTRTGADPTAIAAADAQLSQFTPGPRVHVARDTSAVAAYTPHDKSCTAPMLCDTATRSVDVKDRVVDDFIWQRQPWQLQDGGDPLLVYPGVDYLAAYWSGRYHGFVSEDHAGTCTRYSP